MQRVTLRLDKRKSPAVMPIKLIRPYRSQVVQFYCRLAQGRAVALQLVERGETQSSRRGQAAWVRLHRAQAVAFRSLAVHLAVQGRALEVLQYKVEQHQVQARAALVEALRLRAQRPVGLGIITVGLFRSLLETPQAQTAV